MRQDEQPAGNLVREQFAQIAQTCEASLMRLALRLCRGGHDCAQELVQEALVRGYEAFRQGKFLAGSNARAWLLRILTNHFINGYRHAKRWNAPIDVETLTRGGETGPPQTHTRNDETAQTLLSQTLDEPLEDALGKLPDALRMTVLLVDVDELSYQEAAALLDVPVGTVRSRLARGRYLLKDLLHRYAEEKGLLRG